MLKKILFVLFILLLSTSCFLIKKDTFFSFCVSADYDPKDPDFFQTRGYASYGQYYGIPSGPSYGCSCGYHDNYKGLPKGEIVAFWHTFKHDKDRNVFHETESFYYVYDPKPNIKIPKKGKGHAEYVTFISFGRFRLRSEVLKSMDLTNVPYDEYANGKRFYQVGEQDKLYVSVISNCDEYTRAYLTDGIYMTPLSEFYTLQALEINSEQHEYVKRNGYLDEKAPGLTEKQLKYIKARPISGKS